MKSKRRVLLYFLKEKTIGELIIKKDQDYLDLRYHKITQSYEIESLQFYLKPLLRYLL